MATSPSVGLREMAREALRHKSVAELERTVETYGALPVGAARELADMARDELKRRDRGKTTRRGKPSVEGAGVPEGDTGFFEAYPEAVRGLLEELVEANPEAVFLTGLEGAFAGVATRFGAEPVAAYDYDRVMRIFVEEGGLSYEEAEEHFGFNVVGAYLGESTPVFVRLADREGEVHRDDRTVGE